MDSFEINKIVGAVLAALLIIVGMRVYMELGEEQHDAGGDHAMKAGFMLPAPEGASASAAKHASAGAEPAGFDPKAVVAMLGKANADAGKAVFKKCKACHTAKKGGANKVGPNLWNVVGRDKAAGAGFKYSSALTAKGGKWTLADVSAFLHKPKAFVKGTKMGFSGISKTADLANLVVYLRGLSDNPISLAQ